MRDQASSHCGRLELNPPVNSGKWCGTCTSELSCQRAERPGVFLHQLLSIFDWRLLLRVTFKAAWPATYLEAAFFGSGKNPQVRKWRYWQLERKLFRSTPKLEVQTEASGARMLGHRLWRWRVNLEFLSQLSFNFTVRFNLQIHRIIFWALAGFVFQSSNLMFGSLMQLFSGPSPSPESPLQLPPCRSSVQGHLSARAPAASSKPEPCSCPYPQHP